MTISQRLVRAGLTFVLFGTMAALVPTNGNVFAATDSCPNADTLGITPGDTATSYSFASSGGSLTLNAYNSQSPTKVSFVFTQISGTGTFTNSPNAGNPNATTVNITASGPATETVQATFQDGQTITVTVNAT